ncbi:MAG: ATP-dependent helicase [Candidatus Diapherotrites archaeon]|nr:ATP-dependent helicase [Candidatus Diapherotrites archaeon]
MIAKAREYSPKEIDQILDPLVKEWFYSKFQEYTPPQKITIMEIHNNNNILISSPTGSGKTLSAMLSAINELVKLARNNKLENRVYCLYCSPLRALSNDIQRNLISPLSEITKLAEEKGIKLQKIRVAVRTGDTTPYERQKMTKDVPHIFITTPESLAIILNSPKMSEKVMNIQYIIVDEIHSLCENKRGSHLTLSLERLEYLNAAKPVRIGLSATISPLEKVAQFLVGPERDCLIADVMFLKDINVKVMSPVDDLIYTPFDKIQSETYKLMDKLIQQHKTTLIFTNTRSATERVVHKLKEDFPEHYNDDNIGAHHSSLSKSIRFDIEEKLKQGKMKVVVCSTSLELGIDIGDIDLVILLSSPKSISRALQRIGRSGHRLHEKSKGIMIVQDRDDLVESAVIANSARKGIIDKVSIPEAPADVLVQHLVGMAVNKEWGVDEAIYVIRKAYPYRNYEREDLLPLLSYLNGDYVELEEKKVFGKIYFDNQKETFRKRGKLTRTIYFTNIGTIPDETAIKVFMRGEDKFVGTLDEEFVQKLHKGDLFVLGGKLYLFQYARGTKVYVDRSYSATPTVPSWFSEQLPLSFDLALEIGKFREQMNKAFELGIGKSDMITHLRADMDLDKQTAKAIYNYFNEQKKFLEIPTDKRLVVETFMSSEGKQYLLFHSLYGRRANDALSRFFAFVLSERMKVNIGLAISDNGFVLQIPSHKKVTLDMLREVINLEKLRPYLERSLENTELLKRRFRHVAGRSLLVLRNYLGRSKSVGRQQVSSYILYNVLKKRDPNFPLIRETYREILEDAMDLGNAEQVLRGIKEKKIHLVLTPTKNLPSPFSHGLVTLGYSDTMLLADRKELLKYLHEAVLKEIGIDYAAPESAVQE